MTEQEMRDRIKEIDFYKEISQEEFETLYREYQNNLKDKVYS